MKSENCNKIKTKIFLTKLSYIQLLAGFYPTIATFLQIFLVLQFGFSGECKEVFTDFEVVRNLNAIRNDGINDDKRVIRFSFVSPRLAVHHD